MFIIAEAGVNHNGDMNLAKQLVDAAVDAGVDAVKFQTFKAELIVTEKADLAEYQKGRTDSKSQQDMLRELELKEEDFAELKKYCDSRGIIFLSTPHSDKWSVDVLYDLVDAYKVGSGDLTNIPILGYMASKGKPIILSTGMANMEEIVDAVKSIEDVSDLPVAILHCTTSYPCPEDKVNLRAMLSIKDKLNNIVGYSDHTTGLETPVIAACLGANIYEKHFTLDKRMKGPDHSASLNPEEMADMVKCIRYVESSKISDPYMAFRGLAQEGISLDEALIPVILGSDVKKPFPVELDIAKVARKSIVALEDISRGDVLTESNVGIRRPGTYLEPKFYDKVIGKKATHDMAKGHGFTTEDYG